MQAFFFFVNTVHLHYPQCNSLVSIISMHFYGSHCFFMQDPAYSAFGLCLSFLYEEIFDSSVGLVLHAKYNHHFF